MVYHARVPTTRMKTQQPPPLEKETRVFAPFTAVRRALNWPARIRIDTCNILTLSGYVQSHHLTNTSRFVAFCLVFALKPPMTFHLD